MRTAIPKATNGKNRSNLGAIFSAAQKAKAAIFCELVVLKPRYRMSKAFAVYYFQFLIMIPY